MMTIIQEAVFGSLKSVGIMALIVIPLMIFLQIARDYEILSKLSHMFRFTTKFLGISRPSVFPLLVGVFFGISFGAGVIIDSHKEGNISKRDGMLLILFFSACHGMIEDTLIFAVIGANPFLIVPMRVIVAVILTYYFSKYLDRGSKITCEDSL